MSISVIGASSRQMSQMRNKTELQTSHSQEKCKACSMGDQHICDGIVDDPLIEKENEMSIAYLHKKVERELKEKQRKITLLRQGIYSTPTSPNKPPNPICKEPKDAKDEESGCTKCSSWSRSHRLLVMCIFCTLVISIVIVIIIFVLIVMK